MRELTTPASENYDQRFGGTRRLYGNSEVDILRAAHVCVIGIGGVGSWAVEALARTGVGELTLIDMDDVCVTNINRQIHAMSGTVGKSKIEVMAASEFLNFFYDIKVEAGKHHSWVLTSDNGKEHLLEGTGEINVHSADRFTLEKKAIIPIKYTLHQNFPNPFNPITTLRYDLPSDAFVTLTVFDLLGIEINQLVNATQDAGFKSVQWDGSDSMGRHVSAGVYMYRIETGNFIQTKKMVLLK